MHLSSKKKKKKGRFAWDSDTKQKQKQKQTHPVFNAGLYFFCSWNPEPFLQLKIYRNQNG